jgi:hypothetical protein
MQRLWLPLAFLSGGITASLGNFKLVGILVGDKQGITSEVEDALLVEVRPHIVVIS